MDFVSVVHYVNKICQCAFEFVAGLSRVGAYVPHFNVVHRFSTGGCGGSVCILLSSLPCLWREPIDFFVRMPRLRQ